MQLFEKFLAISISIILICGPFFTYNGQAVHAAETKESVATDLFFSEYIEGSSYNKAIELYNGTGEPIDLSEYTIELYTNGNKEVHSIESLTGTLDNGAVYVLANSQANATILEQTDITSGVANFNGDDVVVLKHGDAIIDIMGTIGDDSDFGKDKTFVRKDAITTGNTIFTLNEWNSHAKDTFAYLGSHGEEVSEDPEEPTEPSDSITIKDARDTTNGETVRLEGVVLANADVLGKYTTYIQDETAGINLYAGKQGNFPNLSKGNKVTVLGELTEYHGLKEIVPTSIEIIEEDAALPEPVTLSIADLQASTGEQYEGQLATVRGYISNIPERPSGNGYNVSFIDADYNSTTLRVMEGTEAIASLEEGKWYDITAIVGQYDSYQLFPRGASDIQLAGEQPDAPTAEGEYTSTVKYVSDGDTIRLETPVMGADRVRFLNIDTPETSVAGANGVDEANQKEHGEAAKEHLQSLLQKGDKVTLKIGEEPTDTYGRLLAEVINKDDVNTNLEMVREGYATSYFIWPIGDQKTYNTYQAAVRDAKDNGKGIWSEENSLVELPFEYRAITEGGDFHRYVGNSDTKEYVKPTDWEDVPVDKRIFFASQEEAEAQGYQAVEEENNTSDDLLDVQLLSMNDLHGKIDQSYELERDGETATYGRMDYTAAAIKQREQTNKNTLLIHAGDMIGGSSPVSALLQDEPTVEIMNEMGFDVGTLGNHEYDEGLDELKRMINGGDYPEGKGTNGYTGMNFDMICANCVQEDTGETFLPPYVIEEVNGVEIGFIGVNTQETMDMVMPASLENVAFTDETKAVNEAAVELQEQGVESIVVLSHMSATQSGETATGPAANLAKNANDAIDVIFAAHNHQEVNAMVDGKAIIQASEYGKAFADVDLTIDPETKDIVDTEAEIVFVNQADYQPDPAVKGILDRYLKEVEPIINEEIGYSAQKLEGTYTNDGDHGLGNLITDGMKWAMDADFAMHNGGGIRDTLDVGPITWGEVFNILPFANNVMSVEIKGEDLVPILNDNLSSYGSDYSVSGLHYTYNYDYKHVVDVTFEDGSPIDPDETYVLAVNNYIGTKDGPISERGTNEKMGPIDVDAAVDYMKHLNTTEANPLEIGSEGRIAKTDEIPDVETNGEVIGYNARNLTGSYTNGKDHGLGNLITDSMKYEMKSDFAVTNGGGIGSSLLEGEITTSELGQILTHGNKLVKMDITGQQLQAILNAQIDEYGSDYSIAGFHYQYDEVEQKVVSMEMGNGEAIDLEETYSITTNNYLASQDGFASIDSEKEQGPVDVEALENYIVSLDTSEANPLDYTSEGRISTVLDDEDADNDNGGNEGNNENNDDDQEQVKQEKMVTVNPTVKKGTATVTDQDIERLADNGVITIQAEENTELATVFTKDQIVQLKAKHATIKIATKTTTLSIPAGDFGDGATSVKITKVNDAEVNGSNAISEIFDFTIISSGEELHEFDQSITLAFKIDKNKVDNPDNVKLYYYNSNTKEWELIGGNYENGILVATTDHFSTFAAFETASADTPNSDQPSDKNATVGNDQTNGNDNHSDNNTGDPDSTSKDQSTSADKELPDTATTTFNWLLLGTLLLLISIRLYFVEKQKKTE